MTIWFYVLIAFIVIGIVTPFIWLYKNKKREARESDDARRKQAEILAKENNTFIHTAVSKGLTLDKVMQFDRIYFGLDSNNKKIILKSFETGKNMIMGFKNIIAYELVEDGQALTKGGTGSAIAGAALFGVAGAIVGSTMKKSTNICTQMQLRITVSDVVNPSIVFDLIKHPGAIKGGAAYNKALNFAKEITATLAVIQKQTA
jgi:uncharacterized membrane protein